eukprot:TRINITY_DN3110_c0_g1_i10.p1 TRINITY_DN3110_c0_g1~~TRINITY_DN3110_c0_g1_i10.p1  ORF type:complete len:886 (+),score=272.28 TRINITY_DN3110_c0_g1_i10:198-2855(+)
MDAKQPKVVPEAPGKPVVSGISSTVLTLKWSAPRDPSCSGFRVDSQANGGEWIVRVRNTNNTKTSRAVMNLAPETSYRFKVYAINPVGVSPPSDTSDTATTRPGMGMTLPKFNQGPSIVRPQTAPVRRPQISGNGGRDEKLIRRRYFFRGDDPGGAACDGNTVFNYHYDVVTLDLSAREGGRQHRAPWAPVAKIDPDTDIETLYFQDHQLHGNSYALQNNLHTICPQGKFDLPKLLSWATSIRPRHQKDALPMFVLLQNLTRSLLEDKIAGSRMAADKEELLRLRASDKELRAHLGALRVSMQKQADEKMEIADKKVAAADQETSRLRVEIADLNARWKAKLATVEEKNELLSSQLAGLESSNGNLERRLRSFEQEASTEVAAVQASQDVLTLKLEDSQLESKKMKERVEELEAKREGEKGVFVESDAVKAQQEAQARLLAAQEAVLLMRSKIAELKGYPVEPKNSQVVRGVLALLGAKQADVESWDDCRKVLGADVCEKIASFELNTAKPGVKMKSLKASIASLEQAAVDKGSEAVGALFAWLTAAIGAVDAAAACEAEARAAAPAPAEAAPKAAPAPAPVAVPDSVAAAAGVEADATALAGTVYKSTVRSTAVWTQSAPDEDAKPMEADELSALFVETLTTQVHDLLHGKPHTPFAEACQNHLLRKHGSRGHASTALADLVAGLRAVGSDQLLPSLFCSLVGVGTPNKLFSTAASALLCKFIALFRKVPEDPLQVSEALSSLADPTATCELVGVLAALQQAVEREGFLRVTGEVLRDEARKQFGSSEGSSTMHKALHFVLSVHDLEEADSTTRLSRAFMGAGVEAPGVGDCKHVRQISNKEWAGLLQCVCDQSGQDLVHAEQQMASLYWKLSLIHISEPTRPY